MTRQGAALASSAVSVSLALCGNLVTGAVKLPPGWQRAMLVIVVILVIATVWPPFVAWLRSIRSGQLRAPERLGPIAAALPPRAATFQNRWLLGELFAAGSAVLSGPAGVGKTQLAAAYARMAREAGDLDEVIWTDARSRDSLLSSLAEAARLLLRTDGRDSLLDVARLLAWLATTTQRWLIVLDDLRDADDLKDLWPPHSQYGRVVVTAQSPDAAVSAIADELILVGHFTPDESLAFLAARLARSPEQAEGAAELAAALDHLQSS